MPDAQNTTLGNAPAPAPEGNLSLENIPIRTMKDDLKNAGTPNYNAGESSAPSRPTNNIPASPFLTPKPGTPAVSAEKTSTYSLPVETAPSLKTTAEPAPIANPFQKTINPLAMQGKVGVNMEQPESSLSLKKTFLIGGIIFVILAGAAGGYYYWMTRQQAPVATETAPVETAPVEVPEEVLPEPVAPAPVFSTDKPNYLVLDLKTADVAKIKTEIKDRAEKIINAEIKTPVEFVVSDENFNPATFKDFAGKFGLKLSAKLLANIEDKFSLFINNDNGIAKLGLVLDAKNEKTAKTQLAQEEALIITELAPLYLDNSYTIASKKFSASQYGDLAIRYNNLTSASELSLDYALYGKKLIIGTSKTTLRSVYDYLKSAVATTSATTTITNTETAETAQPVDNLGQ